MPWKTAENLQTVPVAVSAFTPADIQNRQLTDVRDLQKVTPGLTMVAVSYDTFSTTPSIRGQPTMNSARLVTSQLK